MEQRIRKLEAELQVRDEVEKEVVKRSAISKKMLKTFQERATALEKENEELQRKISEDSLQRHNEASNSKKMG